MPLDRDEGPVYYREIQKNAYLKRIPNEIVSGKLMPLGQKKPPLKPMWTQLCVHNGHTPYLEQYPEPEHPCALGHRPVWRACLSAARHVTASVCPTNKQEYDFLVDTDNGPVRMLAPDWETMQDWVTTLRNKLAELKIVGKGENVYCAPPAAPIPRAAARDPTSPLPPTPPIPPDRVPGIDLTPVIRQTIPEQPQTRETTPPMETRPEINQTETIEQPITENIDISNWDTNFSSLPSTSTNNNPERSKKVAKICGQNICLDDSILNRTGVETTDSDEDFFNDIDSVHGSSTSLREVNGDVHRQTVVVNNEGSNVRANDNNGDRLSNITVIKVSNKEAPHTAIPVLGPVTNVFNFNIKPPQSQSAANYVNIVNTEDYGTVFSSSENDYGHLSLTTTVSLPGDATVNLTDVNRTAVTVDMTRPSENRMESNAVTSSRQNLKRTDSVTMTDANRTAVTMVSTRPSQRVETSMSQTPMRSIGSFNADRQISTVQTASNIENTTRNDSIPDSALPTSSLTDVNLTPVTLTDLNVTPNQESRAGMGESVYERLCLASTSKPSPLPRRLRNVEKSRKSSLPNLDVGESTYECLFQSIDNSVASHSVQRVVPVSGRRVPDRSNVERSQSQNAYDSAPRREGRLVNNSPKRDCKIVAEKSEQIPSKPIWKRGLTELSLLTKLKGIGKRQESPSRHECESERNTVTSPGIKVVHRSRTEVRVDGSRRRSTSLNNGDSPPSACPRPSLQPLLARQAAALRAEQRRGAALVAPVPTAKPPVFADYNKQVWIASWSTASVSRFAGRCGDRLLAVGGITPLNAQHAKQLVTAASARGRSVDVLFHRVPLARVCVVNRRDKEGLGLKLDSECNIVSVEADSPASRACVTPPGKWAVTEVNSRPLNLVKGGEEEMLRVSAHGTEVLLIVQPSALVKKLRAALKGNKGILGLR